VRVSAPDWSVHLPPGTGPGELGLLEHGSLPARWAARWAQRGQARQLRDVDGRWITAAELEERTRLAAQRLVGAGLRPGHRLLIDAESSAAFVIAYVAALRAGLTVVPLNPAYPEPEVRAVVTQSSSAAAIASSEERAGWIRRAAGGELAVWSHGLEQLRGASPAILDQARREDTALLMYTSGTTGALCAGAAIDLRPRFDPTDVVQRASQGATMFFGVPAMYERVARGGHAAALAPLRLLVSGSAPLPAELAQAVAGQAGQIPLERYGMTETVMLAGNPYEPAARRPGTVGFPFPGVDLRLAENTGEVQVRGPNVIAGYLGAPEATAEAFTDDGWFRTGDLGELDADCYLRLVGRSKELIITGGYNVYPREVEEVLATHPAVREVAVIGRPSERWGEEVTAVVVADEPVAADELKRLAAARLAPYKVPKRVEFTDELPRNALGKVVRGKL
jgi:malonyl-CoA/methylmalonyl-CoA synthetase